MFTEILLAMTLGASPSADLSLLGSELALDLGHKVRVRQKVVQRNVVQKVRVRQVNVVEQVQVQHVQQVAAVRVRAAVVYPFVSSVQAVAAYPVASVAAVNHCGYSAYSAPLITSYAGGGQNLREAIRDELRADRESQQLRAEVQALAGQVQALRQALTAPKITPAP